MSEQLVISKAAHAFLLGVVLGILYAMAFHAKPEQVP